MSCIFNTINFSSWSQAVRVHIKVYNPSYALNVRDDIDFSFLLKKVHLAIWPVQNIHYTNTVPIQTSIYQIVAFNKWCSSVSPVSLSASVLCISLYTWDSILLLSNLQFRKVFVVSGDEIQWWLRKKRHITSILWYKCWPDDCYNIFFFYFNGNRNEILSQDPWGYDRKMGIFWYFWYFRFFFVYKWVYWWCGFTIHHNVDCIILPFNNSMRICICII